MPEPQAGEALNAEDTHTAGKTRARAALPPSALTALAVGAGRV